MIVEEEPKYTSEYLEPNKRSIANSLQVMFTDGSETEKIEIDYPVGHRKRRREGIPLLEKKFQSNLLTALPNDRCKEIFNLSENQEKLAATAVNEFMKLLVP